MKDGFHIHHLDGNHGNNDPLNLVMVDGADHARLHSGKGVTVIGPIRRPRSKDIDFAAARPRKYTDDEVMDSFHALVCSDKHYPKTRHTELI